MQTTQTKQTKTDAEIQRQVLQELAWDPRVDASEVGVQVENGVVVLAGKIEHYAKKLAAAEAAHRVRGVLDVVNDLEVELGRTELPDDTEIAQAIRDTLRWHVFVDEGKIQSTVANGRVTLEGEVSQWFQRDSAARAVQNLKGVKSLVNKLVVRGPGVEANRIRRSIEDALERQAEREAKRIDIDVHGGVVTLKGTVRSWSERRAVERAAGFAPGVERVNDQLVVNSYA
jgi:osmotically-inducible protein OsmY